MRSSTLFLLAGNGLKINAQHIFYYKNDTVPLVFYLNEDSYSVYYVCPEEFEYPDINENLPDEIFIRCWQDSIEITVSDEKEIETLVNGISKNTKAAELISTADICECESLDVIARWYNFPLEYNLMTDTQY